MTKPPTDQDSSPSTALGFDEFIGIFVAFLTIGGILLWSFSRQESGWNLNGLLSLNTTAPSATTNPPTPSLTPQLPADTDARLPNVSAPPETDIVEPPVIPSPSFQETPTPQPPAKLPPAALSLSVELNSAEKSPSLPLVTPSAQKSTIPPPIAFNDVPPKFWAGDFIDALSARKIIQGFPDYTFRPNLSVSRAEFAAILQKAFDQETTAATIPFRDVSAEFWAKPAINHAISTKFLKGYPNQTFQPQQNISRSQVLVALASGLNLQPPANPTQVLSIYQDVQDIPKYAVDKVAAATVNGLVVNYPQAKVLAPNQAATRAEVAAMIHQALVLTGKLEKIHNSKVQNQESPNP
ncbi:S-layer protein [Nostoc sp. CENA543]|uniref:S-layer homology domain-containing protein n=1 Tax=Nostoc sp. CENA543 TaxID=1869241 RepID=UPI000CA1EB95|nr:S-layer homology domain-containing protein [Nostoc sp. CENA543]AUT03495.1 S-layer protein [Nostoc sp. CENA543]